MNEQLSTLAMDLLIPRPEPSATPWVAVAGAKGGVGKTTLAVNLALLLQKAGYRTLLADLDPGCGDVGVHLRIAAGRDLDDAAAGACRLHDAIVDGPGGISVLLGKSGSTRLCGESPGAIADTIARIDELAQKFDVVIADTGAGIGPSTTAVAERADLVLAVTTPDAPSLTDTYALAKLLHLRGQPLPHLVVNRVRSREEGARTAQKLLSVALKFLGAPLQLCAWVCNDSLVERSVVDQRPLGLAGQGAALEDLRGLCASVLAALPKTRRRSGRERTPRLRPAAADSERAV